MAMNKVAAGILTGAATGGLGGAALGPWGIVAGAVIGATTGGIAGAESQAADIAGVKAHDAEVANTNALMEDEYSKKKQAKGIIAGGNSGGAGQSSGAVLDTTGSGVDLLG